ncbi:MAG TPA: membrane dipeptidase [bacterium]|nr:membrane dipeptidase [bacterium]
MILVDGHLDMAFNALCFGRDPRESARAVRRREADGPSRKWRGECMVGLPEMRAARVALVMGTLFAPRLKDVKDSGLDPALTYETGKEARAIALRQLEVYREICGEGQGFRAVRTRSDLEDVLAGWKDGRTGDVGLIVLMEGADPVVVPEDVPDWRDRGVRLIGPSWRGTRYAGGTGEPGPLTKEGRKLMREMDGAGTVLDLSHLADESAHEALGIFEGPVVASHSNPRAVCESDRQIPDDLIRAVAGRDGVIGAVPFNRMLQAGWSNGDARVPLQRVGECIDHVTQTAGTHRVAAVGSDFEGGFGSEAAPEGMDTIADLPRIADVLSDLQYTDEQIADVLGRNWIRFLERALPAGDAG